MCFPERSPAAKLFHAVFVGSEPRSRADKAYERHAQALHQLRTAHETLEQRIARILVNKRDRDREIVELYGARKRKGPPNAAQTARLRRLLARRHMCDRSASKFEQMAHVIEQQIDELENCAATEQTLQALRGGVAASAEQNKLMGGPEAVEQLLSKFEEQREQQEEMQDAMDQFSAAHDPYERMGDEEVEDELQRLIEEERIAEQFPSEDVQAVLRAAPTPETDEPNARQRVFVAAANDAAEKKTQEIMYV